VERYPKLHGILQFLRRPRNGSVEQQLELYQDEEPNDQERKRQLFSVRYYLHDLFRTISDEWIKHTDGVTNYAALIDQIRHRCKPNENVCLVTFNYDLLLDRALVSIGYKQLSPDDQFKAHPIFKLFRPHGSVDWARLVEPLPSFTGPIPRLTPQNLIEEACAFQPSNTYVRGNATDPQQLFTFERPMLPAIAIPLQTKTQDFFEWPPVHLKHFQKLLPSITKILIIGWQAKEAHFLKLLQEKLPTGGITQITHLQVVGSNHAGANTICQQFSADIRRGVKHTDLGPAQGGFSQYVQQELVTFLYNTDNP
jgi:hypothetical protein